MFLDILDAIDKTSSRNAKEKLLKESAADVHLQKVFLYALDPFRTYGVARVPTTKKNKVAKVISGRELLDLGFAVEVSFESTLERFERFFSTLDTLASRQLTGDAAKNAILDVLAIMPEREANWAERILLKKLRCGVSEETVAKIWANLVPRFDVQLAETVEFNDARRIEDLRPITSISYPVWVDAKLDGLRCVAIKHVDGAVELRSRNGQLYEDFPSVEEALRSSPGEGVVLDCEILGADWNETQSVAFSSKNKKDDSSMKLHVFDAVPLAEWRAQKSTVVYADRLSWVHAFIASANNPKIVKVPGRLVNNEAELLAFFLECLDLGYEGIMIKRLDATYVFDRSTAVMKVKPYSTHEGKITGFFLGKEGGKREGKLGGIFVKLPNGVITRVGGGLKDAQLAEWWETGEQAMRGRIVEVKGQFLTPDGKIRFPRFFRFRDATDVAIEVNNIEV